MKTYDFPCGCKFPILDENIKGNGDGLPSIGIDFNNIPHDCSLTWDLFSSGRTKGVFQLENKLGQDWSAKIQPHNIDELAAVISVIRPGCLKSYLGERNLTQHFADRKVKGEEVTYIHPSLEPILKSTYGILVYQEQAMKIAVDLAGFNLQEADTLRKAIGKKLAELMSKVEKEFISKAKECKVVPDDIAETVFSWIRESQKYSFNKSHGVGYGELGYWCAYAKAHFPIHFFTSSLYYAKDKQFTQEEIEALVEDAALAGISVCPPTMKHYGGSDISHFYTKDKMIYFGIGDVKKIGQSIANKIKDKILLIEKEIGRKIANWTWYEFLIHFSNEVSSTAINNLIAVGAVDYLDSGMSRARKIFEYNLYKQLGDKEKAYIKYVEAKALGDALEIISKDDRLKITPKNKELVKVLIESFKKETYSTEDTRYSIICAEQELLGIPISCSRTDECSIVGDSMCVDIQFKKGNTSLAVEIINVREHIIKSGTSKGAKMAFLKVKDSSGVLDSVCVFSDKYAEYAALLYKSNTVLLKGQISVKKDVKSFIVNEATQI